MKVNPTLHFFIYSIRHMFSPLSIVCSLYTYRGLSWPWSYGGWNYNYICNQCLSPLMLWVWISIRARVTTLCDDVCQLLATGQWFSPGPLVSFTNKTDCHDITEILLKVALNIIKPNQTILYLMYAASVPYFIYCMQSLFAPFSIVYSLCTILYLLNAASIHSLYIVCVQPLDHALFIVCSHYALLFFNCIQPLYSPLSIVCSLCIILYLSYAASMHSFI